MSQGTGWLAEPPGPRVVAGRAWSMDIEKKTKGTMPYKILVVDDSKLARMAVAKLLNILRPDWVRVEAANADEAMTQARQATFDLALLDFNMPERDGLHLAGDLRALTPELPLAVISANHQKEVVDRANAIGATFLGKPLTEAALKSFIETAERSLQDRAGV